MTRPRAKWIGIAACCAIGACRDTSSDFATFRLEAHGRAGSHPLPTRPGGILDVTVESTGCDASSATAVLTVHLTAGGAPLGPTQTGCTLHLRETVPGNEARLEVSLSTPAPYRVTWRVPR